MRSVAFQPVLSAIDPRSEAADRAESLRKMVALAEEAATYGGAEKARAALERDDKDLDARYALAAALATSGDPALALELGRERLPGWRQSLQRTKRRSVDS